MLFLLVVVLALALAVASNVGTVLGTAAPRLVVVVTAVFSGVTTTFGIAVVARTYRTLQEVAASAPSPA